MRYLVFVLVILAAAAIEASLPRALLLSELRPVLLVPLVFFFALRLNTLEGAVLSLLAGVAQEATSGFPAGRSAFTLVLLFVLMRIVLAGLRGEGRVFELVSCAGLAFAYHVTTLALARTFEPSTVPLSQVPWLASSTWSALATVLVSAPVLSLARRIDQIGARHSELL